MRLSCGARAAQLPWGVCVVRCLICLLWPFCQVAAYAQAEPSQGTEDVLGAPPPTPELTEIDERKPPELPLAPDRSSKPAPGGSASPAKASAEAANPTPTTPRPSPQPTKPAAAASEPPSPELSAAESGQGERSSSANVAAQAPPPPRVDGDFAGGGPLANVAPGAEPQDDFAGDAQEYTRPKKREYSVRIDLLNWLLLGRLSFELEAAVWRFLSVQITPVFVFTRSPIAINYAGVDDPVTQRSNGIGPLSGVSLGVGAWLWGEPFKGYVLRFELTNYGYSYRSDDGAGRIDRVDFTERRALLFIGSHSRFGAFTFAGGFGLGYELNQQTRCGLSSSSGDGIQSRQTDCRGRQQIALDRGVQERMDLNGPLHPVYFLARFSIGAVF